MRQVYDIAFGAVVGWAGAPANKCQPGTAGVKPLFIATQPSVEQLQVYESAQMQTEKIRD